LRFLGREYLIGGLESKENQEDVFSDTEASSRKESAWFEPIALLASYPLLRSVVVRCLTCSINLSRFIVRSGSIAFLWSAYLRVRVRNAKDSGNPVERQSLGLCAALLVNVERNA
jgi:hypothetical protein